MAETITHLFLDTNVLNEAWPALSVKVENTLKTAQVLGIRAVVPQPVLFELRKHWKENIETSLKSAKDTLRKVGTLIGNPDLIRVVPPSQALDGGYEAAVECLLKNYGLEIGPMPCVAIEELFHQANEQQVAFEKGGANFKDVIILHSVIEYLEKSGGSGLLITDDTIFEKRRSKCEAHATHRKVDLTILKLSEAEVHLRNRLNIQQKERIERHCNLARKAVVAFLPAAQAFFNSTLDNQRTWSQGFIPENVVFNKIVDVDVSVVEAEPSEGSEMRISAILRGTARDAVNRFPGTPFTPSGAHLRPIEVGMQFAARFRDNAYSISGVTSTVHGWPSQEGSVGHPNWRGDQGIETETEHPV